MYKKTRPEGKAIALTRRALLFCIGIAGGLFKKINRLFANLDLLAILFFTMILYNIVSKTDYALLEDY